MSNALGLKFQFYGYWHAGGGRGAGSGADASVERNQSGLPFIGGKTLKGLYRDAVYRLEQWGHFAQELQVLDNSGVCDYSLTETLFGVRLNAENEDRRTYKDGVLRFHDATLQPDVSSWILHKDDQSGGHDARDSLFTVLHSTAIDHDYSVAKQHSLRSKEVVVPLTLYTKVNFNYAAADDAEWISKLDWQAVLVKCAPLLKNIGAGRNRGLGRVGISKHEVFES